MIMSFTELTTSTIYANYLKIIMLHTSSFIGIKYLSMVQPDVQKEKSERFFN